MRITVLHPDLGIGGAERLIVDAAVALQNEGHAVRVVTAQYDSTHCFEETKTLEVVVMKYFPRHIFGRCFALCAYVRMILAALMICATSTDDVILCDQVSACLPIFKVLSKARLVFYCHFPDMLLTDRKSFLKKIYRYVLDSFEEWTTGMADDICVNSLFTASVVKQTFVSLKDRPLHVVYPSLNTDTIDKTQAAEVVLPKAEFIFLSLNRYEVKKNIALAVRAFDKLRHKLSPEQFKKCLLIIAGGYDKQNQENISHHAELKQLALDANLTDEQIVFLRSPSDTEKKYLLQACTVVLYTPHNEHFGIVPVEAMYMGKPVLAVNSGGPTESIEDKATGRLLDFQDDEVWADAMAECVRDAQLRERASIEGPRRVQRLFAFTAFTKRMNEIVQGI